MKRLDVHLHGKLIGHIAETRSGAKFEYIPEVAEAYPGRPVLSLALPAKKRAFGEGKTRNWFEGLLPEGQRRDGICRQLGIAPHDWLSLLSQIGWECAGAVQVLPEAETGKHAGSYAKLNAQELAKRLSAIPIQQATASADSFRMSLGGYQDKLCVAMPPLDQSMRMSGIKDVALPQGTAASTHILKPEPAAYPGLAESEAWAMTIAGQAARCSKVALLTLENAPQTLVVERYDRRRGSHGKVLRLHQEDACQALNLPIERKYASEHEQKGDDPTYKGITDLLSRFSPAPAAELEELLRQLTVNMVLGNWDAHAKNTSLLYEEPMNPRIAPMYDVVPIAEVEPRTKLLSMRVNGTLDPQAVDGKALVAEALSWGLRKDDAQGVILGSIKALESCMAEAARHFPNAAARHEAGAKARAEMLKATL